MHRPWGNRRRAKCLQTSHTKQIAVLPDTGINMVSINKRTVISTHSQIYGDLYMHYAWKVYCSCNLWGIQGLWRTKWQQYLHVKLLIFCDLLLQLLGMNFDSHSRRDWWWRRRPTLSKWKQTSRHILSQSGSQKASTNNWTEPLRTSCNTKLWGLTPQQE